MIDLFFIYILTKPQLNNYTCTPKQLKAASEVFMPCRGEKHFSECYEASIRDYCEVRR